jgi:adenylate cyclase
MDRVRLYKILLHRFAPTERQRRFLMQFGVSLLLLLVLLGHVGGLYNFKWIDKVDAARHDFWVELFALDTIDERIVIVDIDEKSLKEIGRWPWPRAQTARLTANLFQEYGVTAVGYDIIFAEPDQSSGLQVLEGLASGTLAGEAGFADTLGRLRPRLDYDAQFAEALATGPSVLGYYFNFATNPEVVGQLPPAMISCEALKAVGVTPLRATGYNANLPRLQAQATTAAFFNSWPDFDGVNRRLPIVLEYAGKCYGGLSLVTTQAGMAADTPTIMPAQGMRPPALDMDGLIIPLAEDGTAVVPFRRTGAFQYVSATDVIHGRAPAANLEGRIVLVGSTAPGVMDLRVTPMSKIFPGVEIHANMISAILDERVLWSPAGVRQMTVLSVLVLGILLALALPFVSPIWAAAISIAAASGLMGLDFLAWKAWQASVPMAVPLLTVVGLFVLNMSYGFFVEARSKAQITRLFGQYVPPELVDEMAKDPARYSLRGESRELTVLFSDIRDFTSISEGLEAAQLADMLNAYLSKMTHLIQAQNGTIDKYIGDAIMAFWGAPLSSDKHARDGVLTALAMQTVLTELNPELEARGWPAVKIGVGVNSGKMSVGNMGSQFRMAYTVMGDAVNLASRLEGLTKQYGVGVLVGDETRGQCPEISFVQVDTVRVKGKALPVAIFEPLGLTAEVAPARLQEAQAFEAALEDYRAKNWAAARQKLEALKAKNARKLYDIYLERLDHFQENPPPVEWDGVFTFTTK